MSPAARPRTVAALAAVLPGVVPALLLAAALGCSHPTASGEATSTEYDGTYVGHGAFSVLPNLPLTLIAGTDSATITLSLSQMGSALSGMLMATGAGDTTSGGIMGSTTGTGAVFTFVQAGYSATSCPATLHGHFTISNGKLTGSATGVECGTTGVNNNVALTFTNLVKQP